MKFFRDETLFLRTLALFALAFILCGAIPLAIAAENDSGDSELKVVSPEDSDHGLLKKTCLVCHRESKLIFFIVTAKTDEALSKAHETLLGAVTQKTSSAKNNPHASTMCLFCHFTAPEEGEKSETLLFRTLDGNPVGREEVEKLCIMCHPGTVEVHPRVVDSIKKALPDLEKSGLIKNGRSVKCSTCHDMHSKIVGVASVPPEFNDFAKNSTHLFPHSNAAGCLACHPEDMKPFGEPVFTEADPEKRCSRCHVQRHESIHQTKVASSRKTYPMDFSSFPLGPEAKTTCSTCHDEPCNEKIKPRNLSFLRGGPYSMFTDFCYNCHPKAGEGGLSPHAQVDSAGNVVMTSCIFCHIRDPDNSPDDPGILAYRYSPLELCVNCHSTRPHPSGVNHIVEIGEQKKKKLEAYQTRHNLRMPIDAKNRVICTTCHNPHAKGVTSGQAALGAEEEYRWRVPSFAELCTPCHARYD
jgi:hypothetical protein